MEAHIYYKRKDDLVERIEDYSVAGSSIGFTRWWDCVST